MMPGQHLRRAGLVADLAFEVVDVEEAGRQALLVCVIQSHGRYRQTPVTDANHGWRSVSSADSLI